MKTKYLKITLKILQWVLIVFSMMSIIFVFIESIQLNLDLSSSSKKDNAKIYQNQCVSTDTQKWKLIAQKEENSFLLQCKHSGLMLAVSDKTDNIVQYAEHDGDNQRWIITQITEQK